MTLRNNSDSKEHIVLFTCSVQMPTLQMGKQNLREAHTGHLARKCRPVRTCQHVLAWLCCFLSWVRETQEFVAF